MQIPPTRRDNVVDDYHGTPVADPYRWLEDASSAETLAWSEAQSALSQEYLNNIAAREAIKTRFTELMDYPKYEPPMKEGGRYYFTKNSGLQNQSVLYMQETLDGPTTLVLDPNTFSSDGTIALTNQFYSHDGRLLAYSTSKSGSDWQEIKIRDIAQATDFDEVIQWSKFSNVTWRHDNQSFYYSRFPQPGTVPAEDESNFNRVYWHRLGTSQEQDQLVFERPDAKELGFNPSVTEDGEYLTLYVWHGTDPENRFYYRAVASDGPFIRLLDEADALYAFIGNDGPIFYLHTDLDAPRGRIIAIDTRHPERENWRELVPEQEDVIAAVIMINHQFVVNFIHHAHTQLRVYDTAGAFLHDIALPTLGSVMQVSGKAEDTELFFSFTSFLYPETIFRYDFTTHTLTQLYDTGLSFDPGDYETAQVFYPSKDGTRIPMFLTYKKGLMRDGNNPTLLYGYGGFNVSETPYFRVTTLLWVEHGGIFASANLRGGGEYGEEWHRAGMLEKKQNVFDDFISAAEWLIANDYTRTSRLAIHGGSNGGLLVGACLVQHPDLYGAVVCEVPVIDMLRYHRFTIGRYWTGEYGDAEHNPEHFRFLYAYSPLHNVKEGIAYPPTLIMTADTDDRVVPAHAKKFTATLQATQTGLQPILLRLEMKAGHGSGKPISKVIEERSDMLAFLFKILSVNA